MSQADRANQESIAQAGAALNSQLDPLPGNLALERKTRVGSYSDVYMGIWTHNGEDEVVCIKCIRNTTPVTDLACPDLTREERFKRRIIRETSIWMRAKHPNVLPFLGYQVIDGEPRLVSRWMDNGSLETYLKMHSNISDVDKIRLLHQAAEGLAYLHGLVPPIAHGDLKPENILITDEFTAALCDMGVSRVILDGHTGLTTSGSAAGSAGFQAKELIMGESLPTMKSDIYAMGGVILETMSGMKPFHKARTHGMVILCIVTDQMCQPEDHPRLPSNNPLWPFLRKCWSPNPEERPTAVEVIEEL